MHQRVCFYYVLRTMWFIAGDSVSRIPALKELSAFKTLGTFTKCLEMKRNWLVNKRGGEGSGGDVT